MMMSDWGRIVNIFYTFSIISFLYLYKKKFVINNEKKNIYIYFFL